VQVKLKIHLVLKRKDFRGSKAEGGLMGELNRTDRGYKKGGFVARGCGAIDPKRKKKTRIV
jgi:hypothetical protein